jgi:hypothetical protein
VPKVCVKDDSEGPGMGGCEEVRGAPGRGRTMSVLDILNIWCRMEASS